MDWGHHVGHDLTKDHKVKLFPGECADALVVGIKVLAALSFAATTLCHEIGQLLIGCLPG